MIDWSQSYDVELPRDKLKADNLIAIVDLLKELGLETTTANCRRVVEMGGVSIQYPTHPKKQPIMSNLWLVDVVDGMVVSVGKTKAAKVRLV